MDRKFLVACRIEGPCYNIFMQEMGLSADEIAAEAGRTIMLELLGRILTEDKQVRLDANMTAVHEMRKAIRRTFTCFKLFDPFFEPRVLKQYRRPLRRVMRRLAASRDLAVFRLNLETFNLANDRVSDDLTTYFNEEQEAADTVLVSYLQKPKVRVFFNDYQAFTQSRGAGVSPADQPWKPLKLGYHVPILVFQRVATVRAFEDTLFSASLKELHRLRIQFKDLRYALEFFAPLLGESAPSILLDLKALQDILGNLNDTKVALHLLDVVPHREANVARYRQYQREEQVHLMEALKPAWEQFNRPEWRQTLAKAVALV